MATSFITKDDKHGFWVHDALFQIICRFLFEAFEMLNFKKDAWAEEVGDLLNANAKGKFSSWMYLNLESLADNDERKVRFMKITTKAKELIAKEGKLLSLDKLNGWHQKNNISYLWHEPLETNRLLKILDFLENVIDDRIAFIAKDESKYKF